MQNGDRGVAKRTSVRLSDTPARRAPIRARYRRALNGFGCRDQTATRSVQPRVTRTAGRAAVPGRSRRARRWKCRRAAPDLYSGRERCTSGERVLTDLRGIVRNLTQGAGERAVARALQHYAKGQIDRAIEVLKEAQAKTPDDPAVLLELGRMLAHAQRGAEGAEAFRALLRRDPAALEKVNESIEELRARHANVSVLYDAVAEHHLRQDDLNGALRALERVRAEDLKTLVPRLQGRWEQGRKTSANGRLTRTTLLPGYHAALAYETLREHGRAIAIYREIARANADEVARILPRLEAIAARDYQNADLRLEVAVLLLAAGRAADAVRQFELALETSPSAARPVAERIAEQIGSTGEHPDLRWVMARARLATGETDAALLALAPLVAAGHRLDDVIGVLNDLASKEKATPARRLLAEAFSRRGQPLQSLAPLLQISEEEGLRAIDEPMRALAAAHPRHARIQQVLADVHLEMGRVGDAVTALGAARGLAPQEAATLVPRLTRALHGDPASAGAHLMLADLLLQAADPARAVVVLRHLVRRDPAAAPQCLERLAPMALQGEPPRAALGAAEACLALGRPADALAHLEALAAAHPEMCAEFLHALALVAEKGPAAGRLVGLLEALEPRSPLPVAVHFARGDAQFRAGDPAAAAASLREVLQSAPERVGEVRQVLERFDRADPRAAEARYLLASILVDQGDHAAAMRELAGPGPVNAALLERVVKRYESAVAATPDDLAARGGLVQALLLARQYDRVLEVGRETLRRRDDATTARVSLAMGDALREKGDGDGAVRRLYAATRRDPALSGEVAERLRRVIEIDGRNPFASLALGKVLAQQGRVEEALEALRVARAADPAMHDAVVQEMEGLVRACPGDAHPGLALATMLQESGDNARAVQALSALLEAHPQTAQRVAAQLDDVLKDDPRHALAQYELGRALVALGAHARASDRFRTAARLDVALAPMALRRLHEILTEKPGCTVAWIASADVLAERGQRLQAAERLAEAIARDPAESHGLLGRLEELHRAHPDDGPLALLFAEACLRAGGHERAARAFGALAGRSLEMAEAAARGLDTILQANPRLAEARHMRARARLRLSRSEEALQDLQEAARLAPRMAPDILGEVETLSKQRPDWSECTLLLADLLRSAGRGSEAEEVLDQRLADTGPSDTRLAMLLRLAQCAAERQDEKAARDRLATAATLARSPDEFLARVHDLQVAMLRRRVEGARDRLRRGDASSGDLVAAVEASVDLGDLDSAAALLEGAGAAGPDPGTTRRLRAAIDLRRGDYPRAAEALRALGPSRLLAHGALRAGQFATALETLEALATADPDARLRRLIERTYKDMVAADLMGGSRRLQAETSLTFGEGAAA